jgi:hypothetical protein
VSAEVTWTPLADTYLPSDLRDRFLTEAAQSTWHPIEGRHPMSPGLAVREVLPLLAEIGLRRITQVAYDRAWVVREDTFRPDPMAEGTDQVGYYTILGTRTAPHQITCWFLDMGHGIAPLALVDEGNEYEVPT